MTNPIEAAILASILRHAKAAPQRPIRGGLACGGRAAPNVFARGGLASRRYDVGGVTPMSAQQSSQQMPSYASNLNNMTAQQLQQLMMRLPIGSQQAQQVQAVLQQKRTMPNVGAQVQQPAPVQQTQQAQQQPQMQGGLARGGMVLRRGFAAGGDADGIQLNGVSPDTMAQNAQDLGDLPTAAMDVQRVPLSDLTPPGPRGSRGMSGGPPLPPPSPQQMPSSPPASSKASDTSSSYASDEPPNSRTPAKPNPWLALAQAGFGMAAGTSPYAGVNIGRGAETGLQNYAQQQKEADTINDAADKLMAEAKQHKDQLAIEQQNADSNAARQTEESRHNQAVEGIQGAALKQKELMKDAFGNPIGAYDPQTNSIIPIKGGAQTNAFTSTGSASVPPQGVPAEVSGGSGGQLPPDMMARLQQVATNPRDQATITGLIQGRIPPTRMALGMHPEAYISAAAEVDPSFDAANPTARMKTATAYAPGGTQGNLITSLNTASRHAAATALAGIDLNNVSGFPGATTANDWINSTEKSAGDPRLNNYNSFLGNYGHEAMKVISGKSNPGEAETADFTAPLAGSGSTEQILGALSAKNGMMLSRAEEMQNAYDAAMGPAGRQQQVVSPEARQAFGDMDTLYRAAKTGTLDQPEAQAARQRLEVYARPAQQQAQSMAAMKVPPASQRVAGNPYPTPKGVLIWGADGKWHAPPPQGGP